MPAVARIETQTKCPHPNDVDRKRIERALRARQRYRYVAPRVSVVKDGYHVESPCCSRNVDSQGGIIDIARLEYLPQWRKWHLWRKDHAGGCWLVWATFSTLAEALDELNRDPQRIFWP